MRSALFVLFLFVACMTASGRHNVADSVEIRFAAGDSVVKRAVISDFDELTYDNIYVEEVFKMPRHETSFQGMAVFGDYLFQCHHANNRIDVYDLRDNTFAFSIEQERDGAVHCNNVDFGTDYFDTSDPFPLLYLEHKGIRHKTSVYRIVKTDSSYTAQRVQTLNFMPCAWSISNNDTKNGYMYVTHGQGNSASVSKIRIPSWTDGDKDIDLESDDALASFEVSSPKVSQDGTIHNNKLFQLKGYAGEGEIKIVDLDRQRILFIADFSKIGIHGEPEGIAWYNNHLLISTVSGKVYKTWFID